MSIASSVGMVMKQQHTFFWTMSLPWITRENSLFGIVHAIGERRILELGVMVS